MKVIFETKYGNYKIDSIQVNHYNADGSACIELWNNCDGPIARLTTCLVDKKLKANMAYIDTNNNPTAPRFIEEYGLGKPTGKFGYSGYWSYPLYEFDMEKLEDIQ